MTIIEALAKSTSTNINSMAYKLSVKAIENKGEKIRTCWTSGSGRYTTNLDYTDGVKKFLSQLGIIFESGNDAKRGGKTGNFVIVK